MPRIDPIQLLKCLSVLLSRTGGIKSKDELKRLAKLMTKFSKKLVSKCIYIQILKCTESDLLGVFMASGGWRLVHVWLTESIVTKNWPLVTELLELLLVCPVDVERLKTNNCPKLVKELSKDGNQLAIRALASKIVEQWLRTVKGENVEPIIMADIPQIIADVTLQTNVDIKSSLDSEQKSDLEHKPVIKEELTTESPKEEDISQDKAPIHEESTDGDLKIKEETDKEEALPVLKISMKDGKQIISQVDETDYKQSEKTERSKHRSKDRSSEKSSSSSSKSSSSKHSSKNSSSDKHRSSSSSHKSSSSSSSSKDRSKDKDKDKERRSSHSSSSKSSRHSDGSKKSSSSSSSKLSSKDDKTSKSNLEGKDKSKDKEDKKDSVPTKNDEPPSIMKLGKIPKLSDVKREKPSISIEVRRPDEPKPKTVKTFHAKFRKHGLEEEIKPPPSRASLLNKKVLTVLPPTVSIPVPKRPSPVHNEIPPEKKIKIIEPVEKPGSIKLIPAKPKPMLLLESDMFMDALNASATNKKEPKKRKRRTSGSKDGNPSDASPPHDSTSSSPSSEAKSVPPRFYQDTLEAEDDKDKSSDKESDCNDSTENGSTPSKITKKKAEVPEIVEPHTLTVNGLKGVLCYHKRKGPKKTIKWKPDSELEEVQYFELDETERVNVTKTFNDMSHLERIHEREAFQKSRNISGIDDMEEKTRWRPLIPFDAEGQIAVEYGKNSKEKEIQASRQKSTLQPLYFAKSMIPDSALEPEPETHLYSEPTIIPLEDVTGNQDNISDFRNMPWPEPKGNAPPNSNNNSAPSMFPANMPQFPNNFPNQFPGVPAFQGPAMVPGDWPAGVPPMMANGMPPGAMAGLPPGAMPPGLMVPPEAMMMGPEMFGPGNPMFGPMPPEGFNMMENMMAPNMFPPDFNMAGGQVPPDGFPGASAFRGSARGRGGAAGWRGKGAGNWDGSARGRGGQSRGGRKAVCIYFQRKGSCRQGDNCTFLHPGVNCPY